MKIEGVGVFEHLGKIVLVYGILTMYNAKHISN